MEVSKVLHLPRKLQLSFRERRKRIAPATQNGFRRVMKNVGVSQSATPATRNEAMRHVEPPKVTTFAERTIGTAMQPSRDHPRTVANANETSSEHT